jgi:hypothetical protein
MRPEEQEKLEEQEDGDRQKRDSQVELLGARKTKRSADPRRSGLRIVSVRAQRPSL